MIAYCSSYRGSTAFGGGFKLSWLGGCRGLEVEGLITSIIVVAKASTKLSLPRTLGFGV